MAELFGSLQIWRKGTTASVPLAPQCLTVPGENHTNPLDQSTLILTRANSPTC